MVRNRYFLTDGDCTYSVQYKFPQLYF